MSKFETKFKLDNVIWVNTKNYECKFWNMGNLNWHSFLATWNVKGNIDQL